MTKKIDISEDCINKQINALKYIKDHVIPSFKYKIFRSVMREIIENNGRIVIVGIGKNSGIAKKISETYASIGIPSMALDAFHYFHGDAGYLNEGDFVIFISKSGKTKELFELFEHAQNNLMEKNLKFGFIHCNNIDIIKNAFITELPIGVVVEGDRNEIAPTTSTTAILATLDSLGVYLSNELNFKLEDFYRFHPGGNIGENLKEKL